MSSNYPSPVSSPSSSSTSRSNVQSPAPSAGTVNRIIVPDDERSESQSNLRQLDAAFQRVRQLRRNILEDNLRGQNQEVSDIAPGHEAIVLTGQSEENVRLEQAAWNRLNAILPASALERLRQFESRRDTDRMHQYLRLAAANMHPLDTTSHVTPSSSHPTSTSSQSPSLLNSPLSPPRQRLLPPRTLQDTQPIRNRDLSDDPSTYIGRRVAAREAGASDSRSSPQNVTEQDFEYIRNLARQRRSEPAFLRRIESSLDAIRRDTEALYHASRSVDSAGTGPPIRGHMRRALRTSRIDSRQSSSVASPAAPSPRERLSVLSNFSSVQNLPTPSSTTSTRPILFEEPTSYITGQLSLEEGRMASIGGEAQGRSYITTRRLTADGGEYVHTINPVWDDGPALVSSPVQMQAPQDLLQPDPGLRRAQDLSINQRENTARTSDYVVPASTYYGALLDGDGNEVPSEELRYSYNPDFRAFSSRGHWLFEGASPRQQSTQENQPESITTRPPVIPDDDSANNTSPRVRLNTRDSEPHPVDDHLITYFGTEKPLFIDPLPMPVEKMLPGPTARSEKTFKSAITVHKHANLAGR